LKKDIKKIAFVSMHTSPFADLGMENTGGMNVYVKEICNEFCQRGISVDVFTHAGERSVVPFSPRGSLFNIPTGTTQATDKHNLHYYWREFAEAILGNGFSYDLIFSHYWLSGLVANELSVQSGTPFVQMFHTLDYCKRQVGEKSDTLTRFFGERYVMQRATRLIAATGMEKHQMIEQYGADEEKIDVISPGVNTDKFSTALGDTLPAGLRKNESEIILLFAGRVQPLKGIDVLLRAIDLVLKKDPPRAIKVIIVGGDVAGGSSYMRELQELCRELKLRSIVFFVGAKKQEDLLVYYSLADILVLPSRYESFGMVALEGMACEMPVIVTSACGVSSIIDHDINGLVVPTINAEALAAQIMQLITSEALRIRIGKAARQKALHYRWPVIASKLLDVFDTVVAQDHLLGRPTALT
jgi:D-inositol-3-phosphate glycosyltransferase